MTVVIIVAAIILSWELLKFMIRRRIKKAKKKVFSLKHALLRKCGIL